MAYPNIKGITVFDQFKYPSTRAFIEYVKVTILFCTMLFLQVGVSASSSLAVTPTITVRLANPVFNCVTGEYCMDVEFQSDIADQELFGMNLRFFYPDQDLEFINFRDFQGGYGPVAPNPPTVVMSPSGVGYALFGFGEPGIGVADFVNGAIQLVDGGLSPIYISTTDWTKLFQICFTIDDPNPDSINFCPSIVWDLKQDPTNGGFLSGDDGVVMTVITDDPELESMPASENVEQFNWMYTGGGMTPPFGVPIENNCITIYPNAAIDASVEDECYYTDIIFQPLYPEIPGASYHWDFGYRAFPAEADGYGPFTVYYDTAGTKAVTLVIYPELGGAACGDSSGLNIHINACPCNIIGQVKSNTDAPIQGVNVILYKDANFDGLKDNEIIIRSVYTNAMGNYAMATVTPGNYVIIETQPAGWNSFGDGDSTPDNDVVANVDPLDNLIPVTLIPSEIDMTNYFIETGIPGSITGYVFDDFDGDQAPDVDEGLNNVEIRLFADANTDGVADGMVPIATQFTAASGSYAFTGIPNGNYVLVEINPLDYLSVKDFDPTEDGDVVTNTNMMDDIIPVSIGNAAIDAENFFIDITDCSILVTNTGDSGPGSLRGAIECAESGDTIRFLNSLEGMTIVINSGRILIDKTLYIHSTCVPRITIQSNITGLFDIGQTGLVEFKLLNLISGFAGNSGAAFKNAGSLYLENVNIRRNPLLLPGEYLISNLPTSHLFLDGNCSLEMD